MKNLLLVWVFIWSAPVVLCAQEKGFSVLKSPQKLESALAQNAAKTQTIVSDFIQEKNMKMLENKVLSHGKFYFKQPDKIRIEYTSPFTYLLIMTGGNIIIKDGGKINKVNTRNSRTMQSVNQALMDCMRGTVFNNKDFTVNALEAASQYLLSLKPLDAAMKKMFSGILVYIQKSNLQVAKLVMTQNNGDTTVMKFSHTKINSNLPDALFFIH